MMGLVAVFIGDVDSLRGVDQRTDNSAGGNVSHTLVRGGARARCDQARPSEYDTPQTIVAVSRFFIILNKLDHSHMVLLWVGKCNYMPPLSQPWS